MKKITAILLTLILSLQMTVVFAAGTPNVAIGSATGKAGETVSVTVDLSNCTEFINISLEVDYNKDALAVSSTKNGSSGATLTPGQTTVVPFNMQWDSSDNISFNGTLATIEFTIAENAAAGTYPLTLSYYKGANGKGSEMDVNYSMDWNTFMPASLGLTYTSGSITVEADQVEPTLSATSTDGKNVTITANASTISGKILAAIYDGNEMTECIIVDAAATLNLTFTEGTGNLIKVMWWDSMDSLTPMCAPAEVRLGSAN